MPKPIWSGLVLRRLMHLAVRASRMFQTAAGSKERLRRRPCAIPATAAEIESLEPRLLLSSIIVSATGDTPNYAANVTVAQLNPAVTPVTLRDAINAVNNTTGDNTITFDPTAFPANQLTTITLGSTLEISQTSGKITIQGPGSGEVDVSGNNQHTVFLIDANVNAEIDAIEISSGSGSIDFPGSTLLSGGGLYNKGTLSLNNDLITKNFTPEGLSPGGGAGVFNLRTLTISNCTISSNSAAGSGGAIANIFGGSMTISDSSISANAAGGVGGGIDNLGTAKLINCTVSSNTSSNAAGGILNLYGNIEVTNCTLAGNIALNNSGGGFLNVGQGAGNGQATITDSTITGNFAKFGGGIEFDPTNIGGFVKLFSTIVAGNRVSLSDSTPSDYSGAAGDASSSHNLIGQGATSGLTNGTNGNLVGSPANPIDPRLGPLADNGGPTQTMALLPGSPALGAGTIFNNNPIVVDQRGVARVAGDVDIGAYQTIGTMNWFTGEYAVSTNGGPPTLASITQSGINLTVNGTSVVSATIASSTQLTVGATTASYADSVINFGSTGSFANQVWTKLDLPANFANLQGNPTHVIQNGNSLTFVDKFGNTSPGTWISPTLLSAFGETVTVGVGKLTWSDGSFWYQNLVLTGTRNGVPTTTIFSVPSQFVVFDYDNGHGSTVHVIETGTNKVIFVDGMQRFSLGSFFNTAQATSDLYPGDAATFSSNGNTVTWQDGYIWTKALAPSSQITLTDYTNPNGVTTHVLQNGTSQVVFVDSLGMISIGQFINATQATDNAYPGDMATFAANTVTWQIGSVVWTATANPPLVITATDSIGGVSHLKLLSASTLVGLNGPLQGIIGTRLNGKINWSNGDVWADFDYNALNAFFEMGTA